MLGDVRGLLVYGIAAAKAGDNAEAHRYLKRVLFDNASTHDDKAQAHIWLTQLTDDLAEKREHLEQVIALDPTNAVARRGLAVLDGRLKAEEIIDPDRQTQQAPSSEPQPVDARRFVCPQCGGTMRFEPGGAMLRCAYCGHRQSTLSALKDGLAVEEHDFVVALATAKGHVLPTGLQTFRCQGCQARLLLSGELTKKCPYCGSPHVVEVKTEEMILPEGIIPFAIAEDIAQKTFRRWLDEHVGSKNVRTTRVRGVYLPAWTFDIAGEMRWRGVEYTNNRGIRFGMSLGNSDTSTTSSYGLSQQIVHQGSHYALENDVLIPATHKLPRDLADVFDDFLLEEAVPYDTAYLADWPAEVYTISVSDASLSARQTVLERGRKAARIQADVRASNIHDFQVTPTNLTALSYKLLLLPLWLANYRDDGTTYAVAINGQTNKISGQQPPGMLRKLFGDLFG